MEQTKPSAEGLRYRKKLKARLSVERAALELVIERGYDGVTVEDICARAEISKKTFFNYPHTIRFPTYLFGGSH